MPASFGYANASDYISPTLRWINAANGTGKVHLNDLTFAEETEVVLAPSDVSRGYADTGATKTTVTDATAPLPGAVVQEWKKTGSAAQWVGMHDAALLTSTPNVGEIWEIGLYAKLISGADGDGLYFDFRGNTATDASHWSSVAEGQNIHLETDGEWHY